MNKLIKDIKESVSLGYARFKFLRENEKFKDITQHSEVFSGIKTGFDAEDETTEASDRRDRVDSINWYYRNLPQDKVKHVYKEDGTLIDIK